MARPHKARTCTGRQVRAVHALRADAAAARRVAGVRALQPAPAADDAAPIAAETDDPQPA